MTLAFSPCPNDTFIFDALVNKKIDTKGLDFEVFLEDVQTLNQWALQEKIDFTKISYGVLPLLVNNYKVLESGGALGKGVGPLLITNSELRITNGPETLSTKYQTSNNQSTQNSKFKIQNYSVAIPGENTTAHLLFSLAYPNATNKIFMPFNEIEDYVLQNENSLGVIIHENRFTYQQKGLHLVTDLGSFWEEEFQLPIPLGAIVAHKRIDNNLCLLVDDLIKKSIEFAFEHYPVVAEYVKQQAQEMEEEVMRKHIDLYVNNFSIALGNEGRKAVIKLLEVYQQNNSSTKINYQNIFLQS
jgi:1,4-dihydroxy-6-naphthoate synthase